MMWLGVVLGLRWGEATGLKVERIDLLRRTVSIASQLSRDRRDLPPKSDAGRRTINPAG